ncbi:hypothetical protein L3X38_020004 [Prunus dulcis]|uniref:Uncharacterized protein n=1 Tax=Prunus dulcis TaxID=3755 RepID=A0AAD4WBW9_PRUDU|nr:hypothetical protein L3X38_020004 [Prunus dulcis]
MRSKIAVTGASHQDDAMLSYPRRFTIVSSSSWPRGRERNPGSQHSASLRPTASSALLSYVLTAKTAVPPHSSTTEINLQLQVNAVGSDAFHHDDIAEPGTTAICGHLGYGPILEQIPPFVLCLHV